MSDSNSSIAEGVQVQVCGQTDVGQLREHNEDNLIIAQATANERAEVGVNHFVSTDDGPILLAVCDGMGGAAAGEVASQLASGLPSARFNRARPTAEAAASGRRRGSSPR